MICRLPLNSYHHVKNNKRMLFAPSVIQQHQQQHKVNNPTFFSTTTPSPPFRKIGIVGLGLMGHGICQVAATAAASLKSNNESSSSSPSIIAYESEENFLLKGMERIDNSLTKLVQKEKMTQEDATKTWNTIKFTTDINELSSNTDLIIEAIIENMDLKNKLYKELDVICPKSTIFASNTSSLSISEMANIVSNERKSNFLGLHFFNPVQIMKLVEVIKTPYTNQESFDKLYNWVNYINKAPVTCNDTPGFIVNRLLVPNMAQAMLMIDRNDATVKDIDLSMKLGAGNPMGPLHLADYVGLDTCYFILKGWVDKYPNEPAFVIPKCLKEKVDAGDLGRKSGKGFYHWNGEKRGDVV